MIKAVIFDMDGVVIDTTGFWADAEREVFGSVGVEVTDELAAQTAGMSTTQVAEFWYQRSPWESPSKDAIEEAVVARVGEWIDSQGQAIEGFYDLLEEIRRNGLKAGLATNSPGVLVQKVLQRLDLEDAFHAVVTFDDVDRAKPDPEVYLKCLNLLSVSPSEAVIVEDSDTGVEAGMASGCTVFHLVDNLNTFETAASDGVRRISKLCEAVKVLGIKNRIQGN